MYIYTFPIINSVNLTPHDTKQTEVVCLHLEHKKNIAKGTTDPRVEFISQVLTQILIKFQFQNLEQASTSKSQPNMNIPTKVKLQNIDQA